MASDNVTRAVPTIHAMMASSLLDENTSPRSKMLRKKVNSDEVDERIVLDVTEVRARDALNDH